MIEWFFETIWAEELRWWLIGGLAVYVLVEGRAAYKRWRVPKWKSPEARRAFFKEAFAPSIIPSEYTTDPSFSIRPITYDEFFDFQPGGERCEQIIKEPPVNISEYINRMPYAGRSYFVSAGELRFFRELLQVIGSEISVAPKVRIADLVDVEDHKLFDYYLRQVAQKHVDFVLWDNRTGKLMLAIELDDKSHFDPERCERDKFVNAVFRDAGIPLLRIPVKAKYDLAWLRQQIETQTLPGENVVKFVPRSRTKDNDQTSNY